MKLAAQTAVSMVIGLIFFGVVLFLPAWTFHYWEAWVFIAVFSAATVIPSIYLAVTNPDALRRRLHAGPTAETRTTQKFVMVGTTVSVVAIMVISALDHRFGWSDVPTSLVVAGNILVGVGLALAQFVVIQNGTFLFVIHAYTAQQARTLVAATVAGKVIVVAVAQTGASR